MRTSLSYLLTMFNIFEVLRTINFGVGKDAKSRLEELKKTQVYTVSCSVESPTQIKLSYE